MSEYRLKAGTLTAAALAADANAVVTSFTGTSGRARWIVAEPRIVTPYSTRAQSLDGKEYGFGGAVFEWTIAILNDAMMHYLYGTVMSYALSAEVTVQTRNRLASATPANQWVTYNAIMTLPELTVDGIAPKVGTFYSNVVLRFSNAVVAASGA